MDVLLGARGERGSQPLEKQAGLRVPLNHIMPDVASSHGV
jgi:hypothetical protein